MTDWDAPRKFFNSSAPDAPSHLRTMGGRLLTKREFNAMTLGQQVTLETRARFTRKIRAAAHNPGGRRRAREVAALLAMTEARAAGHDAPEPVACHVCGALVLPVECYALCGHHRPKPKHRTRLAARWEGARA